LLKADFSLFSISLSIYNSYEAQVTVYLIFGLLEEN